MDACVTCPMIWRRVGDRRPASVDSFHPSSTAEIRITVRRRGGHSRATVVALSGNGSWPQPVRRTTRVAHFGRAVVGERRPGLCVGRRGFQSIRTSKWPARTRWIRGRVGAASVSVGAHDRAALRTRCRLPRRGGVVLKTVRMARNRIGMPVWNARTVIEAEAGAFERWGLNVGESSRFGTTTRDRGSPAPSISSRHRSATSETLRLERSTVLGSVALVCCEDTRRTGRLLQHAGIRATRLAVCNEHTEPSRITDVLDALARRRRRRARHRRRHAGHLRPRRTAGAGDARCRVTRVGRTRPGRRSNGARDLGVADVRYVFEGFSLARRGTCATSRRGRGRATDGCDLRGPHRRPHGPRPRPRRCGGDRRVAIARELTKLYEVGHAAAHSARSTSAPTRRIRDRARRARRARRRTRRRHDPHALKSHLDAGATRRDAAAAVASRLGVPKRTA